MTNKEALEKLVYLSTTNEEKPDWLIPEIAELNKIIKQDLEVLEIIKNHRYIDLRELEDYWVDNDYESYYDNYHGTTNELSKEEFEKLGEYLYGTDK